MPEPGDERTARRLIMRGGWSSAAGFAVRLAARLIFLLVAARLYGPALFGAYLIALAIVEAAVVIAGLSMKRLLFQWLDGEDTDRAPFHVVLDACLLGGGASLVVGAVIMIAVLLAPAELIAPASAEALFILAPTILVQVLLDVLLAATRWTHAIRYEVVARSLVQAWIGALGAILFFAAGFAAQGLALAYWTGTLAALLYALWGARHCFGSFGLASWRPRLRGLRARVLGMSSNTAEEFAGTLYGRIDIYLVGIMLGEAAAGIYGMARQISVPIRQIRQGFDGLLIPIVSRTLATTGTEPTGKAIASAGRVIIAIQLPLLLALVALGVPLLSWFGPVFAAGYWALIALTAAELIQSAFGIGDLLFAWQRPKTGLAITLASALIGIVAGLLLIPALGITGAGLSVLLSFSARAVFRRQVLRSQLGVHPPFVLLAPLLGAAAAGAATIMALNHIAAYPAVQALGGLAAYGVVLATWLKATGIRLSFDGFVARAPE